MKRLWYLDKCQVWLTGVAETEDLGFEGYALTEMGRHVQWKAWPRPNGYELDLMCVVSRNGASITGTATVNLGLELASFIRRTFP